MPKFQTRFLLLSWVFVILSPLQSSIADTDWSVNILITDDQGEPRSVFCEGATVNLTATHTCNTKGTESYSWSPGGSAANPLILSGLPAGNYTYTVTVTIGNESCTASAGFIVCKVESITGVESLYCTHQDCSANITAVLTDGASLPEDCSIVWDGDADFSNQSGLTVTAKFANHTGKNKKVTAKIGSQSPAAESSAYTVVEHTEITGVTVITYNFVWADPGADYGITTPQTIAVDIAAYFNHPGHTWKCKVTSATDVIQQGWHLAGVSQASTAAATTEAIYRKMATDLQVYGEGEGILWYIIEAVQAHETSHSNDWKAILNPYFSTIRTTIEALSVPYVNDISETPAQARATILALPAYITAYTTLINGSMDAWESNIPDSETRAYAAEVPLILLMIAALDNKAALQMPPWTR